MSDKKAGYTIQRSAKTGKIIQSGGHTSRGGEVWVIGRGHKSKTVVTSPSSAAAIRRIATARSSALERLAKK